MYWIPTGFIYVHDTYTWKSKNQPVTVVGHKGTVVFDGEGKIVSLIDEEVADVDDPEENIEQSHVHVVIVTIIH